MALPYKSINCFRARDALFGTPPIVGMQSSIHVYSMINLIFLALSKKPKESGKRARVNRFSKSLGKDTPLENTRSIMLEGIRALTFKTKPTNSRRN